MPHVPIPLRSEIKPSANVNVSLFSSNVTTTFGTVFVVNQTGTNDRVSVALLPTGNVLTSNSWIAYDTVLYPGQTLYLQQVSIGLDDSIVVKSRNGASNFIFTGYSEDSP